MTVATAERIDRRRTVKMAVHQQALHRIELLQRLLEEKEAENERLRVAVEYRINGGADK